MLDSPKHGVSKRGLESTYCQVYSLATKTGILAVVFMEDHEPVRKAKLRENLDGLLNAFQRYLTSEPICELRSNSPHHDFPHFALNMPLGHARGSRGFQSAVERGALLSNNELKRLGARPTNPSQNISVEVRLGTADYVFTFAGPLRYAGICGFLFDAGIEKIRSGDAIATPFDSGGLIDHFRPNDTDEQRVKFLQDHELSVPEYRGYFELVLATLFDSPWNYVDGTVPDRFGPIAFYGGDSRRWTFEVRFLNELLLESGLVAVFLPVGIASTELLQEQLIKWDKIGVDIIIYVAQTDGQGRDLLEESVKYIKSYLG